MTLKELALDLDKIFQKELALEWDDKEDHGHP